MTASFSLQPGHLFAGEYRVVRMLGEGGMGAVFVAEQLSTGIQRALKLMHPALVQDPQTLRRFEQEARVGASIQSDHVVQVVDAGVDPSSGMPWIAMELLLGETLAHALGRGGPMPWPDTAEVFAQLCHALGAAHRIGIVHRDLKPENVFLAIPRRQGIQFTVKVLDFGIAKILVEAQSSSATTSVVGTPLWMAPEQAERNVPPSPATDVWSLGLLAFNVLTSKLFWAAAQHSSGTITALLKEMLIDPIPAASVRAAELQCARLLPPGFDAWFARCTARAPTARFRDAAEACAALERVLPAPISGWPGSTLSPSHAPPRIGGSSHPQAHIPIAAVTPAFPAAAFPTFGSSAPLPPAGQPALSPTLTGSVDRGVASIAPAPTAQRSSALVPVLLGLLVVGALTLAVGIVLAFRWWSNPPSTPSRPTTAAPVASGTSTTARAPSTAPFNMPALTLMVSAGAGSGVSHTGFFSLYRYEATPVNYAAMWDKGCLKQNMSPCSEAQWARACEKEPILAGSPSWTMTVQDGKVAVRGGDSCASRKMVAPSDVDPARVVSCCSPAVPLKADQVPAERLPIIEMRLVALDLILTKRSSPTKDFFAERTTMLGAKDMDRNQLLARFDVFLATQPRPWITTESCEAQNDGPDGVVLSCRRYFYESGKLQVMNTRMRMQTPNLLFREVLDVGVVQTIGR